jgi:hypothetical protein
VFSRFARSLRKPGSTGGISIRLGVVQAGSRSTASRLQSTRAGDDCSGGAVIWQEIRGNEPARGACLRHHGRPDPQLRRQQRIVHNCIYQEQYLEIASKSRVFAGRGHDLRKAIGKKIHD